MNRVLIAGIVLTIGGIAGYTVGITADYPGRSLTITAVMIGITMVFVHRAWEEGAG